MRVWTSLLCCFAVFVCCAGFVGFFFLFFSLLCLCEFAKLSFVSSISIQSDGIFIKDMQDHNLYGKTNFLWRLSINENGDTFCFIHILTVHCSFATCTQHTYFYDVRGWVRGRMSKCVKVSEHFIDLCLVCKYQFGATAAAAVFHFLRFSFVSCQENP